MIQENVKKILKSLPLGVGLVVASKSRKPSQIKEAIDAGASVFGENYVKEAQEKISVIGNAAQWHCIGHLQRNKAKLAAKLFDMIETVDSLELAVLLDKECVSLSKKLPILIELNSGGETQKAGVMPGDLIDFIGRMLELKNIRLSGLMTMGPVVKNSGEIRPYFKLTHELFLKVKETFPQLTEFRTLSMGMSDTYEVAIEEGATIVRLGSAIFGKRT